MDEQERKLWTVFAEVERLAAKQYELWAPELLVEPKKQLVEQLNAIVPHDEALANTSLQQPLRQLLAEAEGTSRLQTLFIQGLLLERLGQTTYQRMLDEQTLSEVSIPLAELGVSSSETVLDIAPPLIEKELPEGSDPYNEFVNATRGVLNTFDAVGEAVDDELSERFKIDFADLVGDFTAELIPTCCDLGMNRREVVIHLTGAFMGL